MDERLDLTFVDQLIDGLARRPARPGGGGMSGELVPILHAVQRRYGYLPEAALRRLCERTDIPPAQVVGVSSFYSQFRFRPVGRHRVRVCVGTACHVQGATAVLEAVRKHLRIPENADTDADGEFTVEKVACLGCCTLAPVAQIGEVTYGHLSAESAAGVIEDFLHLQSQARGAVQAAGRAGAEAGEVRISMDTCCLASGARSVCEAFEDALAAIKAPVVIRRVGCRGMSYTEPLVEVAPAGGAPALYASVRPEDAMGILLRHFRAGRRLTRARHAASAALGGLASDYRRQGPRRIAADAGEVDAFLSPQQRIATEQAGQTQPTDLAEYRASGGYEALAKVLGGMTPPQVIDAIRRAGLRGRGGAGYPSFQKWSQVRHAQGAVRYVICNGDEGDPGAFMDRMLLEAHPYRVIEGLTIAAYAVGASEGVLYIRDEYPIAVRRVQEALARLEERGLLGERILGAGFSLHLRVLEGAGAFVCGEETALIASIEGQRGTPRPRPPYPAESGLYGRPTLVNNVETLACVPWIFRNGPEAFAALGTATSKGTKVFALAGKVRRGGMIEVPMGATIRRIVEEIGGGVPEGRTLKAVQIGGPSGGCLPESLADTPIDYEALNRHGAMMGSGGLVVLDDTDCMVEIARYFLQFTQNESCGRCTFCRIGTRRMKEVLERLCGGTARPADLGELEDLARHVQAGSLCGLGKTAPNPVLSTLRYFRDEYEAHVAGRCPAKMCKALIRYWITDDCIGCTKCAQGCPSGAIEMNPYEKHEIDVKKCVRCGACKAVCPSDAVRVE